ncbi:restriction endonuclease [Vibrio splendidus]|uniref:restriction endonuclease n=1 Tax=Vibrio sp. F12 TaxID=2070776 RepID=UPI0010BE1181|nr:restriction endonuclease [Vibrio sp. F12]TKE89572.1 restriction endonuclease [Vibrio sp. F12]
MSNNGRYYESFVASLQKALFDSEQWAELKNICIEQNKKIIDKSGIEREFDLYWEYDLGGISYKTVIECKDYASTISIEKIDALVGKVHDLPDLKAIFATKTGYQSGAKIKAEKHDIELLIVRESNDSDWMSEDGSPYIKEIHADIIAVFPARITSFDPKLDSDWIKKNTDLEEGYTTLALRNDLTYIDDVSRNDYYSIKILEERLGKGTDDDFGERDLLLEFDEAYLILDKRRLKVNSIELTYWMSKPMHNHMVIDASKELEGVIEYLSKRSKTAIFKDRVIKDWR